MIPVQCKVYIDDLKNLKWPDRLACRPQVGDRVTNDSYPFHVMQINTITHATRYVSGEPQPYLILELRTF
jgi:hypothetical protein